MSHGGFWNIFASFAERLNRFGEIDGIPGSNGRHQQMKTTGAMHLILKLPVTQFAESAKEELTGERVERFSFIQTDQHPSPECFVTKILKQEGRSLQFA